ncbi:sugar phosphate isomerase/epimerase family protein [Furfurilactobacillus entadae]|uniref:sugar phosphate isomerase/epimerase family protein n=1 Tax=Furfurilactobacillus entadae TaxID=2922307 RepID=UPI0035E5A697
MKRNQIVLNNLLFDADHQAGEPQLAMLQRVVDLNITNAEIRREYFFDLNAEMAGIKSFAEAHDLKLFYSVPDALLVDGGLNPKLAMYFDEAEKMGVSVIKFNVNENPTLTEEQAAQLADYAARVDQINVENNQIKSTGSIEAILAFMQVMENHQLPIGYVYDMGNWRYVDDDEVEAAKALTKYVRYIHVKDDLGTGSQTKTVPLGRGDIKWQSILAILPTDVPVALEYPVTSEQEIGDGIEHLLSEV